MRSRIKQFGILAAASAALLAGPVRAEITSDRYWGQLEGYWATVKSTARLDFPGTNVPGTELSLEDDLGLSDRDALPSLLLGARLWENWRVEFEYYQLNRTGVRSANRTINWGDLTFPVSASISSKFDTTIYRLSGGYSFYKRPEAEAGVALGFHVTDFAVGLSGNATTPNQGLAFSSEQRNQLVPLPTIGLYGHYTFGEQWTVNARVDYFNLNYNEYNGSLTNWTTSISWRFMPNFGAGLGYRYVDYKVGMTKPRFHGDINYKFNGPTLYVEGAF
jgi:hypothetical protein